MITDTLTPDVPVTDRTAPAPASHRRRLTDRPIVLSFPERVSKADPCRFATFLHTRREQLGLSRGPVARATGLSHRTISDLEISPCPPAKVSTIVLLHCVLNVPAESLMLLAMDGTVPTVPEPPDLRAVPDYGNQGSWLVWMPGDELQCTRTTATSCTCDEYASSGTCPCVAFVRQKTTGQERAA